MVPPILTAFLVGTVGLLAGAPAAARAQAPLAPQSDAPTARRTSSRDLRAAPGTVTGRVVDASNGQAVALAQVVVVGKTLGATTDDSGRYRIPGVPAGEQQVTARRVGYAPQTRRVSVPDGGTVAAEFSLERSATILSEAITTATGEQKRVEVGHAVGILNADSLARTAPVTTIGDILQARIAGVQVFTPNGAAGVTPRIRIRGMNSLTVSNDPVLIIDGVRVDGSPSLGNLAVNVPPFGAGGPNYIRSGRMGDFSPADIESVELVKGPAATTLYGTDAANGVIVITTKKGRVGRPRWTTNGERSMSRIPDRALWSAQGWGHAPGSTAVIACDLQNWSIGTCIQDSTSRWNPLKNPDTSPLTDGWRTQAGAQVSGGIGQFRYYLSGDWVGEDGPFKMPPSDIRYLVAQRGVPESEIPDWQMHPNTIGKVSLRANINSEISPKSDVFLNSTLIRNRYRTINATATGIGTEWAIGYRDANEGWGNGVRPALSFAAKNEESLLRYVGATGANWRPTSWLVTHATLGVDFSANQIDFLTRTGEGSATPATALGTRTLDQIKEVLYSFDGAATSTNRPREAMEFRSTVGAHLVRLGQYLTRAGATGLPPGSETVLGAATLTSSEATNERVTAGVYVEERLGWKDRLFVTPSLRLDGGSGFGRTFTSSLYKNVNVSWVASDEPWMPKIPGVSSLRLRGASGTSAVQAPATATLATVTPTSATVDGTAVPAVVENQVGNNALKPERQNETEAGVDLELWRGRVRVEVTGFNKKSHDALITRTVAGSVGSLTTRYENVGIVDNTGWEGMLTARLLERSFASFDLTLNRSQTNNKLESAALAVVRTASGGGSNVQGYPLYSWWLKPILGWGDANGDGIISWSEVKVGDTAVYIGPGDPSRSLTVNGLLGLFEQTVKISTLVDFRSGFVRTWNTACQFRPQKCPYGVEKSSPLELQAWAAALQNPQTLTFYGFTTEASYGRLREVSLSTRLPARALRALQASGGELTFAGRNLALWGYRGVDPEATQCAGHDQCSPFSLGAYPVAKSVVARLSLNF